MKDETIIILVVLICLTAIQLTALLLGINGAVLSTILTIIGGVAGYGIKTKKVGA